MNVLELFSGTGSVGKVCEKLGWNTVSVDMILPADHQCDIMDFDYKQYPKDYFGIIWASPPCTEYSIAKTTAPRNLELADKIVRRVLIIIKYFQPLYWFIENPVGLMRSRQCVRAINKFRKTCSYCKYGKSYRKNTDIWTNKNVKLQRCESGNYCHAVRTHGKHMCLAQSGPNVNDKTQIPTRSKDQLYTIPTKLIKKLLF